MRRSRRTPRSLGRAARARSPLWSVLAVATAAACAAPPTRDGDRVVRAAEEVGQRCRTADDCAHNLLCSLARYPEPGCGIERPAEVLCRSEADCTAGLVCATTPADPAACIFSEGRACLPPCRDDASCQPWELCNRSRGICEVVACGAGGECPANFECPELGGACSPLACDDRAACADGWVCYDELCMAPNCASDDACEAGEYCVDGRCGNGACERDADCDHPDFATCVNGHCAPHEGWCNEPPMAP